MPPIILVGVIATLGLSTTAVSFRWTPQSPVNPPDNLPPANDDAQPDFLNTPVGTASYLHPHRNGEIFLSEKSLLHKGPYSKVHMGNMYWGSHTLPCVIKSTPDLKITDPTSPHANRALIREIQILNRYFGHPSLPEILAWQFPSAHQPGFIVMQEIAGEPLSTFLCPEFRMPLPICLSVIAAVLEAIFELHHMKMPSGCTPHLVHGDLKPENILLTRNGMRILDWGLAHTDDMDLSTDRGHTPGHLAPEIIPNTRPTHASDIYAVGITLLTLLGKWPNEKTAEIYSYYSQRNELTAQLKTELSFLNVADDDLNALTQILASFLHHDPAQRPNGHLAAQMLKKLAAKISSDSLKEYLHSLDFSTLPLTRLRAKSSL